MVTIRRDYRDLLPALRHRHDPASAAWARFQQPHDVHLTIDADLQLRVARIVAAYAEKSSGRAAAVVLDPDSGELLASVSYPWPDTSPSKAAASAPSALRRGELAVVRSESANDALIDRARYGLYPPGSTFKLVTASAALRQHVDPRRTTFTCARLPDGRVGARISGWNRPVRDDVMDNPHGTIDVHDGFVHSCNAFFAQLAVKLGSRALLDTAERLGISLTPSADVAARVRQTLPQIGYGQGDVVVTPLKLARVSAAIASNGVLRDTRCEQDDASGAATARFLNGDDARVLGGYMRDVVLSGDRPRAPKPSRPHRRQDRNGAVGRPAVSRVVRRLRAVWSGHQTNRVRRRHRERRLRRPQRGAGRRRNRGCGIACRPGGMS